MRRSPSRASTRTAAQLQRQRVVGAPRLVLVRRELTRSCISTRAAASPSSRAPECGRSLQTGLTSYVHQQHPRGQPQRAVRHPPPSRPVVGYAHHEGYRRRPQHGRPDGFANPVTGLLESVQTFPLTYHSPMGRALHPDHAEAALERGLAVLQLRRGVPPLHVQPELPRAHRLHQRAVELLMPSMTIASAAPIRIRARSSPIQMPA